MVAQISPGELSGSNCKTTQNSCLKADVVELETDCPKCGTKHKIYAKLADNPNIDKDFAKRKIKSFPKSNKIRCRCGFEIDLTGMRNEIETQTRRKILS